MAWDAAIKSSLGSQGSQPALALCHRRQCATGLGFVDNAGRLRGTPKKERGRRRGRVSEEEVMCFSCSLTNG